MLLDTPADLSAQAVPWNASAAGPAIAHETRRSLARRILMEHLPKDWIRMRPDRGRGKGEFGPPRGELQALHLRRRKCQTIHSESGQGPHKRRILVVRRVLPARTCAK